MRNFLSFVALALFLLCFESCSFAKGVKGNNVIANKEYQIDTYDQIELSGSQDLYYEQKMNESPYLRIEMDENLLPFLEVLTKDGILSISTLKQINPTQFKIYTNSKELSNIHLSGSGKIHLQGAVTSPDLSFSISGSGSLVVDSLVADKMSFNVSGSGKANLKGKSTSVTIGVGGSGSIDAFDLIATTLSANIGGSGKIKVNVSDSLRVGIAGSGSVFYKGSPKVIEKNIAGSGRLVAE